MRTWSFLAVLICFNYFPVIVSNIFCILNWFANLFCDFFFIFVSCFINYRSISNSQPKKKNQKYAQWLKRNIKTRLFFYLTNKWANILMWHFEQPTNKPNEGKNCAFFCFVMGRNNAIPVCSHYFLNIFAISSKLLCGRHPHYFAVNVNVFVCFCLDKAHSLANFMTRNII